MQQGPHGAGQRPFLLVAESAAFRTADEQAYPAFVLPAVLLALEEMVEEALLPLHELGQVKALEMRSDMGLQPFLPRAGPQESFDIAAQMQTCAAPVGGRQQRHIDPRRSEEHTSELQSLMRISYAVFCLKKKKK